MKHLRKTVTVGIVLPPKLKARLSAAARAEGLGLSPWLRRIALKAIGEAVR